MVAEVLQGIRRSKSLTKIEKHFCEMEWLTPQEPETYLEAADLYRRLRERGPTIRSTIDCIIAKLAGENDALVLSRDRDPQIILESKLIDVRALPLA